ncbi:MAG: prenyltransferase/squalene oxidase repeat-containing protein, partial [Candidatus Thorarchaeota archaeon SMTZ1-45]
EQNGVYMSVLGDFTGDGHLDVAAVWSWTPTQYNLTVYTAYNGTYWGGYLGNQYISRTTYDNGTLYTGGNYGYQYVPVQGVAADWDDDGIETLVLQMNSDVYNDSAGHALLETSTVLYHHYEGNPTAIELNSTFGLATQPYGYDFTAPPMVAADFITESGNRDWIAVAVPLNETHRTVRIVSNAGAMLASVDLVRAHTSWLVAADINGDGIDDLVLTDFNFEGYEGFPSPSVIAALDGRDLSVIFEELPCTNGWQGIAALHVDVADIDSSSPGLEIVASGMNCLVVFGAAGNLLYYETFEGVGLFSFFVDIDEDGSLEIVRALSNWSLWASGYSSVLSTITEFVMMIPGSLTADEWFAYLNENATVSAQFIAPFEDTTGVNITLWNATVMPGQGFYDLDLHSPIIDSRVVDLTAGVPYLFQYEWNSSLESWNQMAFTVDNHTSVDMTIGVFAIPIPRQSVTYADYQDLINKGLRWLLTEQQANGSWLASTEYEGDQWDAPSVASTAMAVISLINNGTVSSNVLDAVNWILLQQNSTTGAIFHQSQNQTDVVETTWAILALKAFNGTLSSYNTTINDAITAASDWLMSAQYQIGYVYYEEGQPQMVTENSLVYGGWSPRANYTDEPVDTHVTSLALFALSFGGASSSEPFDRAQVFITRAQNYLQTNPLGLKTNDGGFLGIPNRQVGSIGSATGAGVFAMAVSGASQTNPEGFQAAIDWINNNFIVDEHVGIENYLGGLYFTRMLFITDYWFFLNLGMIIGGPYFNGAQFAMLDQVIADFAQPDAGDTASWGSFFGGDAWRATAMSVMTLQTRHGPNPGKIRVEMHSNAYLTMMAPDGSTIGYNHTTGLDMTPLGSTYSGAGSDPQVIEIPNPQKGHWTIVADGNSTGTIDIYVMSYSSGGYQVLKQLIVNFDVNDTSSLEFDLNVIRMIDIIGCSFTTR